MQSDRPGKVQIVSRHCHLGNVNMGLVVCVRVGEKLGNGLGSRFKDLSGIFVKAGPRVFFNPRTFPGGARLKVRRVGSQRPRTLTVLRRGFGMACACRKGSLSR